MWGQHLAATKRRIGARRAQKTSLTHPPLISPIMSFAFATRSRESYACKTWTISTTTPRASREKTSVSVGSRCRASRRVRFASTLRALHVSEPDAFRVGGHQFEVRGPRDRVHC